MLDLSQKRICVTGGSGFLGSHVVNVLKSRNCASISVPRKADYDLTTQPAVERLFADVRPQVLIHAAAVVGGIGANRANPGRFFYENAIMGIQVIEQARRHNVEKIVVLGTVCAYPKFAPVPFSENDLWAGYPEETNAPYGIAKKALLVQCQAYREQYGVNAIYLLLVNLFGPGDNFDVSTSHVIPALIRRCLEAKAAGAPELVCWGTGRATREFLFVEDAAEAIVSSAEHYDSPEPCNIGAGTEVSIAAVVALIAEMCEYEGRIVWDSCQPDGQPRRCLDVSRAAEAFGFHAKTKFEDGLRRTIDWYRRHYVPATPPASQSQSGEVLRSSASAAPYLSSAASER